MQEYIYHGVPYRLFQGYEVDPEVKSLTEELSRKWYCEVNFPKIDSIGTLISDPWESPAAAMTEAELIIDQEGKYYGDHDWDAPEKPASSSNILHERLAVQDGDTVMVVSRKGEIRCFAVESHAAFPRRIPGQKEINPLSQESFRLRLRRARRDAGLTQEALAGYMGVTALTIRRWENGRRGGRQINVARARQLANILGVSLYVLFPADVEANEPGADMTSS